MELEKIKGRITIRTTHIRSQMQQLSEYLNEDDVSKIIEFAILTSLHHLKYVTNALVDPKYDVIFQRKRVTNELKRRIY